MPVILRYWVLKVNRNNLSSNSKSYYLNSFDGKIAGSLINASLFLLKFQRVETIYIIRMMQQN